MRPVLRQILFNKPKYGAHFDGTNDYLTKGSALSGVSNGKAGLISFWFKLSGGDAANRTFFGAFTDSPATSISVFRGPDNKLGILGRNAAETNILSAASTTTYTSAMSAWAHCAMAWDLATGTMQMYVDGADVRAGSRTVTNDTINSLRQNAGVCGFGEEFGGVTLVNGDIAELYVNLATTLDISNTANLQRFRTAGGCRVNLGIEGSTPTGTQPAVYFSGGPTAWATNRGSGGAFTLVGSLTTPATNPPCDVASAASSTSHTSARGAGSSCGSMLVS